MNAIGASRPLQRIPAIVSFLNPQPAHNLDVRHSSSCPEADLARHDQKLAPGGKPTVILPGFVGSMTLAGPCRSGRDRRAQVEGAD